MNREKRNCQNCKNEFVIEPEDFDFYKKIEVPPPTWCPECRMVRRMVWRNERTLYKRVCERCGDGILSIYAPNTDVHIYCNPCWFADGWGGADFGVDYDFSKPFFVQWIDLLKRVPLLSLWAIGHNVESQYCNYSGDNKNCYLSFSILYSENVLYSHSVDKDTDCVDSSYLKNSDMCYENVDCYNNHNTAYLTRSHDCIDSIFLFDCVNCQNCFMSSNLRNGSFVFRNEQLDAETYRKRIAEAGMGDFTKVTELRKEFEEMVKHRTFHKFANIIKSQNVTGNNIENSKNVKEVFEAYELENSSRGIRVFLAKEAVDVYGVTRSEIAYETIAPGFDSYKNLFSFLNNTCREIYYSTHCHNSSNLFGCIGLRNKSYCVFNKQYTKEEYEALVPKIVAQMNEKPYVDEWGRAYGYGEFFPPNLSPFMYNETVAQEYFPLTKEEALKSNFRWRDPDMKEYTPTMVPADIPDTIKDVRDDITKETIQCEHRGMCTHQCVTAFRVIPQELQFYRRMNLPLPRLCPNCRHHERLAQRTPPKLWHRKCMKEGCVNEFETSYAPERPEIVYCESCYQAEVV